jgi:hypothetical protein
MTVASFLPPAALHSAVERAEEEEEEGSGDPDPQAASMKATANAISANGRREDMAHPQ